MKNKILFGIMALVMGIWATGCSDDDYAINQQPLLTDNSVVTGSADVTAISATLHGTVSGLEQRLEQGVAPFLFYPPYFYDKTSISFNPETSTYLQSFSTESLRQDNQVEIYEGNADVIYVPIEPMN